MCFFWDSLNWKKRSLSLLFWWVLSFFDEQSGLWRFSGSLVYGESVKCRGVTRLWRALVSRVFMCWLLWSHLAMRLVGAWVSSSRSRWSRNRRSAFCIGLLHSFLDFRTVGIMFLSRCWRPLFGSQSWLMETSCCRHRGSGNPRIGWMVNQA